MREILFHGKRINNGEWVEGYYAIKGKGTDIERHYIISSTFDGNTKAYPFYFTDIEVDPKTVCQYTGLTDRNGRKIFEGDIVKSDLDKIGKIAFNESHMAFMILESRENRYYYVEECDGNHIEIIGNIFDNPELIN